MPYIDAKIINFLSKDLLDPGPDNLKLALGNSYIVEEHLSDSTSGYSDIQYSFSQPNRSDVVATDAADPVRDLIAYRPETDPGYEPFGVPRLIENFEANVYNVTMINPNSYVPNFKIPIRFYANAANSKGDLYWNTYWTGGNYDGKDYFPLINESRTLYTTNSEIYLPYLRAALDKDGFEPHAVTGYKLRTFSVKANYPNYDEHVQSRIDYESQLPERLLPNYNFMLDVIHSHRDADFTADAYESGMAIGGEKRDSAETQLREWYLQDSISRSRNAARTRNIYFGTHWPMLWGEKYPARARENADRHQENIMFDQYYYEYYTTPTGDRAGAGYPYTYQNLLNSSKMYEITVEFTTSRTEFATLPLNFRMEPLRATESHGQNLIRDIIEENNFSSKFLETLKDIEEGTYPDFPQTNTSYATKVVYGDVNGEPTNEYSWTAPTTSDPATLRLDPWAPRVEQYSEQQFKSFDWLYMLAYLYNNPTVGVNDNFIFMGPPEIRHHTTNANNTTYRYIETIGNLSVLDATIDHLEHWYRPMYEALRQNEYYSHGDLKMPDPSTLSSDINEIFMQATDPSSGQILAYRVDKFEATPAGLPTGEPIQKFWFFNAKDIPSKISLVDSQVKFGKHYVYRAIAYVAIIAHKYKYTNLRLTKQIGKYEIEGNDTYCVQYYNPYTQLVADQTFASKLASPDIAGDVTYQTTGLSNYNLVATLAQDFINYPQAADLFLNIQPCLKILEVPLFEKTCGVFDNPSNGATVDPFHFMDASNRVGFSIKGDPYKPYFYPTLLKQSDKQMKDNYLSSKELFEDQYVDDYSRSPPRYLEMYRISKKPTSFYDFGRNLVSKIDLRIPGETYNLKDYIAVDKIVPNKTYYYVFRFINENGMPSWPSSIIETQLVNDGGYIYSLFEHFDTAEFIQDPFENPSTSFKKLVHLEPNIQQLQFDTTGADFSFPANTQLDAVKLGVRAEKLWDKKFKIRLTSKKTGKKIDLNVTYDVKNIDMSNVSDYYLDPDDTDGARSFITSTLSG
jgi:hypothetical protein